MGSKHIKCSVSEIIIDKDKKLVTTPAYMEEKSIKAVAEGIEKLVKQVVLMIE
jgi:enhancing lycopene biosynthesis protein 2